MATGQNGLLKNIKSVFILFFILRIYLYHLLNSCHSLPVLLFAFSFPFGYICSIGYRPATTKRNLNKNHKVVAWKKPFDFTLRIVPRLNLFFQSHHIYASLSLLQSAIGVSSTFFKFTPSAKNCKRKFTPKNFQSSLSLAPLFSFLNSDLKRNFLSICLSTNLLYYCFSARQCQ